MIFWVFAVLALLAWPCAILVFVTTKNAKTRGEKSFGRGIFVVCSLILMAALSPFAIRLVSWDNPKNVFYAEFGVSPNAKITDLNSSYRFSPDSETVFLTLGTDAATIRELTKSNFKRREVQDYAAQNFGCFAPNFWKLEATRNETIWEREKWGRYSGEECWLLYGPETQRARYFYFGVD